MRFLVAVGIVLCSATAAQAQDWAPLDARSRALGGAGVAFADGRVDSMYWNPASLAFGSEKPLDFSNGWGFSFSYYSKVHGAGNVVGNLDHIRDLYNNGTSGTGVGNIPANFAAGTGTDAMAQDVVRLVDSVLQVDRPGEGLILDFGVGLNIRVGPFGLFVRGIANAGGDPFADFSSGAGLSTTGAGFLDSAPFNVGNAPVSLQGIALAATLAPILGSTARANALVWEAEQALGGPALGNVNFQNAMIQIATQTAAGSPSGTLDQNASGVAVRALAQVEAGIAFGMPLLPTLLDVGIAFKMIHSEASFASRTVAQISGSSDVLQDVLNDFKNNRVVSNNFNFDLGARLMPLDWLTLSLSARNVIPMDIPVGGPGAGTFHQDPIIRFGAMGMALGFIRVGMDIDLLQQSSFAVTGYNVRRFGMGAEFDLPALIGFPLMIIPRIGYSDNLAMSNEAGWLTAGLALKIFAFTLDLGAQMALEQAQFKSATSSGGAAKSYPAGAIVGLTLAVDIPF